MLALSAVVRGVGVAREARDTPVFPAEIVTILVIISRETVTTRTHVASCTANPELQCQCDPVTHIAHFTAECQSCIQGFANH